MKKIVGFYDTCFFNVKTVNDYSGVLVFDEETGNTEQISHSEIRKQNRKALKNGNK